MPKTEEYDLKILIQYLENSLANQFKKELRLENAKKNKLKIALFDSLQKRTFDKDNFVKKHLLSSKQFSSIKFKLLQNIINYLKINYAEYSIVALRNYLTEFELMLNNGLYIKANRKLKLINEIALARCDFNTLYSAQRKAISYNLFNYINKKDNFEKESKQLIEYSEQSRKLHQYELLKDEILRIHYKFLDRRAKDRGDMLQYLDHELLKDESKPKTILSKYYFYLTKSLIYLGDNNYYESKKNALLAYEYLIVNSSKYRDDYMLKITTLNNYLDASLNLLETKPFETMYPKMLKMKKAANYTGVLFKANDFQYFCSLHLNYLWLKKDYTTFLKVVEQYEKEYSEYEPYLSPNFKLEILLGLARMYFEQGCLEKANLFCNQIIKQKSNPTSLFLTCGKLLSIMINVDMGNYRLIPHLINTGKYLLKNRDRLFEIELLFFNSIKKLKQHFSNSQKKIIYKKLYNDIKDKVAQNEEMIIDKKIRILEWLKVKAEE